MRLHCLNTELSTELTALVECSEEEWSEIEGHWVAAPNVKTFKEWFTANYVEKDWFIKTPLYVVHIRKG